MQHETPQPSHLGGRWKIIDTEMLADGTEVSMHYAVFGKGKGKIHSWKFFRGELDAGYASTASDATENWERVKAGLVRNRDTGRWTSHVVVEPNGGRNDHA